MAGGAMIVGVGMVTSVGLGAEMTAASVRASISRMAESRLLDQRYKPFVLAEVPDTELPPLKAGLVSAELSARERRMLRMAAVALADCLANLPEAVESPPLFLALPEPGPAGESPSEHFLAHLAEQCGAAFDLERSESYRSGRVGGLTAIGRAAERMNGGGASLALAGGVDTYRDSALLAALDAEGRVASEVNPDGFIPGEGAGFLLLTSERSASNPGLAPLASTSRVAMGFEEGHLYSEQPCSGNGLAEVVARLAAAEARGQPIQAVSASMNGESHWAREWGVAYIRNSDAFAGDHEMHHPADCFGDTGAASGPLQVGLTAIGLKNEYRRAPGLVYCSSDRGERAGLIVHSISVDARRGE